MATRQYWMDRTANRAYRTADQQAKQLEKIYKQAYKTINDQIKDLWLGMDGQIDANSIYQNDRLNKFMEKVTKVLENLGVNVNKGMQETLLDVANDAWADANRELAGTTSHLTHQLAREIVNASYKNAVYKTRVAVNMATLRGRVERCVIDSAICGRDVRKTSRELAKQVGSSINDAKRLTYTETNRVMSESCRQNAESRGYKTYHLRVEADACDECKALEGEHFDIGESVLPVHPYCKCCMEIDVDSRQ